MSLIKNENLALRVCAVHYALCSNVSAIAQGISGNIYRSVTFKSGTWKEIKYSAGSADFQEPAKDTASGLLFNQSLKLFFPGHDSTNIEDLNELVGKPILVKITYNNGTQKLLGDLNNPVKLLDSYSAGTKTGYMFDFRRQSNYRALLYE